MGGKGLVLCGRIVIHRPKLYRPTVVSWINNRSSTTAAVQHQVCRKFVLYTECFYNVAYWFCRVHYQDNTPCTWHEKVKFRFYSNAGTSQISLLEAWVNRFLLFTKQFLGKHWTKYPLDVEANNFLFVTTEMCSMFFYFNQIL